MFPIVIHMARCDPKYSKMEYEGVSLAYQCGLVKGEDRTIQQYRRNLVQLGASSDVMLELERITLDGVGTKSGEQILPRCRSYFNVFLSQIKHVYTIYKKCYSLRFHLLNSLCWMMSFGVTKRDKQCAGIVSIMISSCPEASMPRASVHDVSGSLRSS